MCSARFDNVMLGRALAEFDGKAVAHLARKQRGYVTRGQLLELGLGRGDIAGRLNEGALLPVHTGVYAVGHISGDVVDQAAAAVLACGPRAALSHGSAAAAWGLARWEHPLHVVAPGGHDRPGIVVHRSTALAHRDFRCQLGVRATSPARTLLDWSPSLTEKALRRAVNNARHECCMKLEQLADVLARFPRHPGAKLLRPFVEVPKGPTRSEFEDVFLGFCTRFSLPEPLVNTTVLDFEVDAFFTEHRLIVELDGWDFHRSREAFETDRERDAATLAAGLATLRVTWQRLSAADEREATRLRKILAIRAPRRAA